MRRIAALPAAVLCLFCVLVPLLFAVGLCAWRLGVWHQHWPYDSFLPSVSARFGDFAMTQSQWNLYHFHAPGLGLVYFPATYLPLEGLGLFSVPTAHWISTVFFLTGSSAAIGFWLRRRGLAVAAIGILLFLISYPTLIALMTGNIEGWVGTLLLVAFALNARGWWKWAAVVLGLAVAMKGIPVAFLPALWVWRDRGQVIRSTAICIGTAVASTLLALIVLPGGLLDGFGVVSHLRESQILYSNVLIFTVAGTHYGNSFLNGVHAFFGEQYLPSRSTWPFVLMIGGFAFGAAMVYALRRGLPAWMVLALSASAGCLLVPTSADYKLLYFLPSIISLLSLESIERRWLPGVVLTCLIITPKPWGLRAGGGDVFANAGVYLTPLLMIVLSAWIIGLAVATAPAKSHAHTPSTRVTKPRVSGSN